MTPDAQRKQLERERRKAGLVLLSEWVPADKLDACRDAIAAVVGVVE